MKDPYKLVHHLTKHTAFLPQEQSPSWLDFVNRTRAYVTPNLSQGRIEGCPNTS